MILTTFREALAAWIAPAPAPEPTPEKTEPAVLREAAGANVDADEDQWRRLTGDSNRDLSPISQARMRKTAAYLWDGNPLANRLIELPLAYLLADGVSMMAPPAPAGLDDQAAADWKALQTVLDDHWRHPINQWEAKLPKRVREFALFGELALPAFTNEIDGSVTIGYLDPDEIATVVMDPDNREQPIGIVTVRKPVPDGGERRAMRYRVIINGPETLFSQRTQALRQTFTDGELFYARCNELCASSRGRSDLRALSDFLDVYDDFVFGEAERYNFLRAFFWDVTITGANQDECEARAKKARPPRPGSVRFHNESEEWQAVTPDLKATDTAAGAELVRNHVLGGGTVPSHWYGGGGDVNRSTGESMGEPTFKIFSMRQQQVKHLLQMVGCFVLRKHLAAQPGEPDEIDWRDPRIAAVAAFPEMTARDTTRYAAALTQVVAGVASAIADGLMTRATGVSLIASIAVQLGVKIDPDDELASAAEQKAADQEKNRFTGPTSTTAKATLQQQSKQVAA